MGQGLGHLHPGTPDLELLVPQPSTLRQGTSGGSPPGARDTGTAGRLELGVYSEAWEEWPVPLLPCSQDPSFLPHPHRPVSPVVAPGDLPQLWLFLRSRCLVWPVVSEDPAAWRWSKFQEVVPPLTWPECSRNVTRVTGQERIWGKASGDYKMILHCSGRQIPYEAETQVRSQAWPH